MGFYSATGGSDSLLYFTIASFIESTIYFTSSSVTYGPAGRHIPTLKISSLTPLVYAGALA